MGEAARDHLREGGDVHQEFFYGLCGGDTANARDAIATTPLSPGATYRLTVGTGVTDVAGNPLAAPAASRFTAVRSETKGVVREVYAVDGQMVEEGQLLFALAPKG